ncbi:MAG: hypothetical protein AAGI70_00015 [Pseudomonadota bacterium]
MFTVSAFEIAAEFLTKETLGEMADEPLKDGTSPICGTREKTVRQQASTDYRKAGVGGGNELTAWFF